MRQGIFDKTNASRYQGIVGEDGAADFEKARRKLKRMAKWPRLPSDGDVFHAMAIGWEKVEAYLKARNGR